MAINISVSGSTLKECHEQILALSDEIRGYSDKETVTGEAPITIQAPVKFESNHAISNEVDSRGLPWDARIHSSNKEQGKDGVWRRRRGVDPALEAQVEAELRGQPSKQAPPFGSMSPEQYKQTVASAPIAPMPTTEHRVALPEAGNVLSAVQAPAQPAPTFAPPTPAQVLPPNTHNQESFRNSLVSILNDLVVSGKINHDWINQQKVQFGGKDVTQWHENQAACAGLFEAFVGWKLINRL